jgi:hypothetical protein
LAARVDSKLVGTRSSITATRDHGALLPENFAIVLSGHPPISLTLEAADGGDWQATIDACAA